MSRKTKAKRSQSHLGIVATIKNLCLNSGFRLYEKKRG